VITLVVITVLKQSYSIQSRESSFHENELFDEPFSRDMAQPSTSELQDEVTALLDVHNIEID
jgi:hypothetical protein